MLDSFKVQINAKDISLSQIDLSQNFSHKFVNNDLVLHFVQSKETIAQNGYLPKIEIIAEYNRTQRKICAIKKIYISGSIPKILLGTNYFSVTESDYPRFIDTLIHKLTSIGLNLTKDQIETAKLTEIAFCYNFYFNNSYPYPIEYLKRLNFLDLGKNYSARKSTNYLEQAEGYNIKLYNNLIGLGIYDKRAELKNNNHSPIEKETLKKVQTKEYPDKILRFEVTLQNTRAITRHLPQIEHGLYSLKLKDAFKQQCAQAILQKFFNQFMDPANLEAVDLPIISIEAILNLAKSRGMTIYEAEAWLGRSYAMQFLGANEYTNLKHKFYPKQRVYENQKRWQKISLDMPLGTELTNIISTCKNQLTTFNQLTPTNIPPVVIPHNQVERLLSNLPPQSKFKDKN